MSDAVVCGKTCAHGSECLLLAGHWPRNRHESQHGCVFFDVDMSALESPHAKHHRALVAKDGAR